MKNSEVMKKKDFTVSNLITDRTQALGVRNSGFLKIGRLEESIAFFLNFLYRIELRNCALRYKHES
jgi:hypothetical protein